MQSFKQQVPGRGDSYSENMPKQVNPVQNVNPQSKGASSCFGGHSNNKENSASNQQYPGLKIPPGSWIENGYIMTPEIKEENGQRVKYIYKQKIVEKQTSQENAAQAKNQARPQEASKQDN